MPVTEQKFPESKPGVDAAMGNCTPRYITIEPSDGCSLTRADIRPFTKEDFQDQGFKEVGMDKMIAMTKEARLAGVPQRGLTDLLLSRHTPFKEGGPKGAAGNGSVIAPYTLVPRRNVVNANYFHIDAVDDTSLPSGINKGTHHPTWGYIPTSALHFTVTNGAPSGPLLDSDGSTVDPHNFNFNTSLKDIYRFFLPGCMVYIEATGTECKAPLPSAFDGDSAITAHYEVVASVPDPTDAGKAHVVLVPNVTEAKWKQFVAGSGHEQNVWIISKGLLVLGANSISDYERWCHQMPAVNPTTLIEYWQQTSRWSHSYSDEYLAALNAPLTSEYFKRFRQLPIAEQRRQQEMLNERAMYNTVFYGDRINEKQYLESWTSLPTVEDPGNPGCTLEYKSNTIGIRRQLAECGRLQDKQSNALNLNDIFETCYLLKRERENQGASVAAIDAFTNRFTAVQIRDLMVRYYKAKYGTDVNIFIQANQKLVDSLTGKTVFTYNMYDLPDQGLSLAVFHDSYFDDRIGAAPVMGSTDAATNKSPDKRRQNSLWFVDWTDVDIVTHSVKSVKRQTNVADNLYNCVIQPNVHHYSLNSKKYEVRVGNTNRHVMIENFSSACPTLTVQACDVTP